MNFVYPITKEKIKSNIKDQKRYNQIEIGQIYDHWSSSHQEPFFVKVLDKKDGKILVNTYCAEGHFEFTNINE